jgi:hypothetical protein
MEITDGWWTWFDNEDLNRTLQIALERNYDIAAAAARLLFISCRTKLCACILMKAPRSRADGVSGYRNNVYYIPQQAAGN